MTLHEVLRPPTRPSAISSRSWRTGSSTWSSRGTSRAPRGGPRLPAGARHGPQRRDRRPTQRGAVRHARARGPAAGRRPPASSTTSAARPGTHAWATAADTRSVYSRSATTCSPSTSGGRASSSRSGGSVALRELEGPAPRDRLEPHLEAHSAAIVPPWTGPLFGGSPGRSRQGRVPTRRAVRDSGTRASHFGHRPGHGRG